MTKEQVKLTLAILPAVAAAHPPTNPTTPEQARQVWTAYLSEAASVAKLFEDTFLQPDKPVATEG